MAGNVMVYDSEDMKFENLRKNPLTLVDFWAAWCGPCRMMAPILEELAAETEGVVFAKVDVDQNPEMVMGLGITSIPTLMLFRDGAAVERIVGLTSKEQLKVLIDRNR